MWTTNGIPRSSTIVVSVGTETRAPRPLALSMDDATRSRVNSRSKCSDSGVSFSTIAHSSAKPDILESASLRRGWMGRGMDRSDSEVGSFHETVCGHFSAMAMISLRSRMILVAVGATVAGCLALIAVGYRINVMEVEEALRGRAGAIAERLDLFVKDGSGYQTQESVDRMLENQSFVAAVVFSPGREVIAFIAIDVSLGTRAVGMADSGKRPSEDGDRWSRGSGGGRTPRDRGPSLGGLRQRALCRGRNAPATSMGRGRIGRHPDRAAHLPAGG